MTFEKSLMESLGIELVSLDKNLVVLTMPVDERTLQPSGYLHGGANVALAESAASIGASAYIEPKTQSVFGIEINANHVKSKQEGLVTARAKPFHIGKTTMIWEIKITDEMDQLICISRCTIAIVPKRN